MRKKFKGRTEKIFEQEAKINDREKRKFGKWKSNDWTKWVRQLKGGLYCLVLFVYSIHSHFYSFRPNKMYIEYIEWRRNWRNENEKRKNEFSCCIFKSEHYVICDYNSTNWTIFFFSSFDFHQPDERENCSIRKKKEIADMTQYCWYE